MSAQRHRVSAQARQEATEWFVSFREGETDAHSREAFYAWLRKAPDNVHAYLRMTALWEDAELLKGSGLFDRDELLRRAAQSPNVVELEAGARASLSDESIVRGPRRFVRPLVAAASVLLLVGAGLAWAWLLQDTYSTGVGEQRTVALADGSTIVLNARSRVRVDFDPARRDIELLSGEAIFRVARDAARPFVVHTGATTVRAVGTQFDVYRKKDATTVTVIEGRVAVARSAVADERNLLLAAGEQITVSHAPLPQPRKANVETATAWTKGELVFDSTPLSEVIEEFNRYSKRRLIVEDPQLLAFHISGVFASSEPARIAALLRQRFGVTVHESDDEIRIVRP